MQELCTRGNMLDAIDRGLLQLPDARPNLHAILATAVEVAGACCRAVLRQQGG